MGTAAKVDALSPLRKSLIKASRAFRGTAQLAEDTLNLGGMRLSAQNLHFLAPISSRNRAAVAKVIGTAKYNVRIIIHASMRPLLR
jgi:hypothetical protein